MVSDPFLPGIVISAVLTDDRPMLTGKRDTLVPFGSESALNITALFKSIEKNTESRLASTLSFLTRLNEVTITADSLLLSYSISSSLSSLQDATNIEPSNASTTYIGNLLFIRRYFSTCKVNKIFINPYPIIVKFSNHARARRTMPRFY